jgi:hypothetical protein
MPKLNRGRVTRLDDMQGLTAEELAARAAQMDAQANDPQSTDDPTWLRRWAEKLRQLAARKARARDRKSRTRGD